MRHNKKFNHLSRTSAHRKAMLSNMASSLIESKRITTTVAKAKELRTYVEPLITKAKNDTTHSRRMVFRYLQNKNAVSELFREVADKVGDRPGGYTRILRTGNRLGDNAEMCIIELVDYNEAMLASKEEETAKPKRRRSRRSGSGKKAKSSTRETGKEMKKGTEREEAGNLKKEKPEAEKDKKQEDLLTDQKSEEKKEKPPAEENNDSEGIKNKTEEGKVSESKKPETPENEASDEDEQASGDAKNKMED
jgi:large subunit ribosomal protein L17